MTVYIKIINNKNQDQKHKDNNLQMIWFIVFNTTFNNIFQLYRGGQFYHINVKKNDNNEKEKFFY